MNYSFGKACEVKEKRTVQCTTLDALYGKSLNPPDFLSLDAQASEYEILEGAEKLLQSSILGIRAETEFIEIYKGQKTFDDLFRLLIEKGFLFVSVDNSYPHYYTESVDYIRGKGFLFSGDALFVKDFKNILSSRLSEHKKREMLYKLATISLCFSLYDYAYHILREIEERFPHDIPKERYELFCIDYGRAYKKIFKRNAPRQIIYGSVKESFSRSEKTVLSIKGRVEKNKMMFFYTDYLVMQKCKKESV